MAYRNKFNPKNLKKYIGDPSKIYCRSLWERKFCKYLDESKKIIRWSFEPIKIPYLSPADGKMHKYIPDFLLEVKKNNSEVEVIMVEIKPEKQTKEPTMGKKRKKTYLNEAIIYEINAKKWDAAKKFCDENGIQFKILTEKDLF
jgi:hypothetical protein